MEEDQIDEIMPQNINVDQNRTKFRLTVEPVLFILFLTASLSETTYTNVLLNRSCLIDFNKTEKICSDLADSGIQEQVQEYVAKLNMAKSIIEAVLISSISIFIGPWSDKNGRMPFLLTAIAGYCLNYTFWILFYLMKVPAYFFLFISIPSALTGGLTTIFVCVYCYISDISNESNRSLKMSITSILLTAGIFIGYLSTTFILKYFSENYIIIILSLAAILIFSLFIYLYFFVPESLIQVEDEPSAFFTFDQVIKMWQVLTTKRPCYGRLIIFLLGSVLSIDILILNGELSFRYLATMQKFGWNIKEYTTFSLVLCVSSIVFSSLAMLILKKLLKFRDINIAIIIIMQSVASAFAITLSSTGYDFYLANNLGVLVSILVPLIKSEIAHIVPKTDTGKIFAFIGIFEAITPLAAAPSYTLVYEAVINTNPLAIYYLSFGLWIFCALMVITVILVQHIKGVSYQQLENENDS